MKETDLGSMLSVLKTRIKRSRELKEANCGPEPDEEKWAKAISEIPVSASRSELLVDSAEIEEIKSRSGKIVAYAEVVGTEEFDDGHVSYTVGKDSFIAVFVQDSESLLVSESGDGWDLMIWVSGDDSYSLEIDFANQTTKRVTDRYFSGNRPLLEMTDEEGVLVLGQLKKMCTQIFDSG